MWINIKFRFMKGKIRQRLNAVVIMMFLFGMTASATDGYFSLGYNAQSRGFAGAGVALYSTSLIGGNPAAHVFYGDGWEVGVSLFSPNRKYTISGFPSGQMGTFGLKQGTVESDKPFFIIPSIGGNWLMDSQGNSTLGVSIYGNGGMNTEYPDSTFYTNKPTGVNLSQLFTDVTYSTKLNENHSVGISLMGGFQMFEANGLESFSGYSSDPTKLTGNDLDYSYGFGFKVGYLGQLTDALTVGLQYQSKMYMTEFEEYAGLFAEAGDFDVPSVWTAGIAYEISREVTLVADVKRINYSEVKAINNGLDKFQFDEMGALVGGLLGSDDGAGFGWQSMMIYKLGVEYSPYRSNWVYRAGGSYGKQPIPDSEMMFNILAPGVTETHVTAGVSRFIDKRKGNAIHVSFMYAPEGEVVGSNPMEVPGAQEISLNMSQFEFSLGYSF